jgi:hypothetical protein
MTYDDQHDRKVARALINTAELGGFTQKTLKLADDGKNRSITLVIESPSSGFIQDPLPLFEREPELVATVDSTNGHVVGVHVQPGDHAETEVLANAEIAAAAGETDPDETASPQGEVVELNSKKKR